LLDTNKPDNNIFGAGKESPANVSNPKKNC
jgi:hypothetical protein